jgi:transcription elongation factor
MDEQGRKRRKNKTVPLTSNKHKLTVKTREGGRVKLTYRRFRDKRGKVRHEIIGPFILTDGN